MNEFINNNHRSVELPEGCKDLIDVLKPKWRSSLLNSKPKWLPLISCFPEMIQTFGGELKHIRSLVRRFLRSSVNPLVLIRGEQNEILLTLLYEMCSSKAIIGFNSKDRGREETLLRVFRQSAIVPTSDVVVMNAGVENRVRRYPLPTCVQDTTKLITELLRQGYGISERSRLCFVWFNRTPTK